MHQPAEPPVASVESRLARCLLLARAALAWERLWPLVLPPVAVASLFVSLVLADVLPALPGWLHALVLAAFAGSVSYLAWRAPSRFRPPTLDEARRRIERDSGIDHRPLAALADRPAGESADPVSMALWQAHRRRMARLVDDIRVAWPEPGMAARDPYGVRAAVLLVLVIAAAMGGHDWARRLDRAVTPALDTPSMAPDLVEVWVTPPSYTGAPPVMLRPNEGGQTPALVPAGSTVLSVLTGGWGTARLVIDGVETPFQRQGDGNQRIETHIESGRSLGITQARRQVAEWPIRVVPDALPSIAFDQPPTIAERGRMRFDISASDDYGLAQARIDIRRIEDTGDGEVLAVPLPLPGGRPRTAGINSWHDLTAHPWAGLPVALVPVARDALGQEGYGEPMTVILPERQFNHPIARAVIEQRRLVTEDIANAPSAAAFIGRLTAEPGLFDDDLKVFLALRSAREVLLRRDGLDLPDVQDLLWSAALRIEEGDLSEAERALEAARRDLENAIAENASAAEMERLIDDFQAALERYLDALGQRMAETGQPPGAMSPSDRVVTDADLADMLDSMRAMAETGARDALRRMLEDMSSMLSNLQTAPSPQPSPQALEALDDLNALTQRQQQLLDQTFRQSQQQQSGQGEKAEGQGGSEGGGAPSGGQGGGGSAGGDPAGAARSQQSLQRMLDDVMKRLEQGLGATPGALPEAGRAMGDAAGLLGEGQWGDAAEAQGEAVQRLRDAGREAAAQLGAAGTGSSGLVPRDPLGRPMTGSGHGDDGTTAIPSVPDIQRAREILDELRRRSGEAARPEAELDYLKRLLRQF